MRAALLGSTLSVAVGLLGCGKTPPEGFRARGLDGGAGVDLTGRPDIGVADLGPPDLGPFDSGRVDAGARDLGRLDTGAPTCDLGDIRIEGRAIGGAVAEEGVFQVVSAEPLVLRRGDEQFRFELGADVPRVPVAPGEPVVGFLQWTGGRRPSFFLILQSEDRGLVFAAWATESFPFEFFEYRPEPCAADPNGCGRIEQMVLVVEAGERRELPPGTVDEVDGYRIQNGRSFRYPDGSRCMDTPSQFFEGAIVLRR